MIERAVAPVVIVGIGNPMRHDDGIGPAAIAQLAKGELSSSRDLVDLVTLGGEATRLMEAWRGRDQAIVIDAGRAGADPGTIHRLTVGIDPLPAWANTASSHSAGLAEAIDLARVLDALPTQLIVFGVEPGDLSMGEGFSAGVESALPRLVERVVDEVRSMNSGWLDSPGRLKS